MLELKNITKDYVVEKTITNALKGISLSFRKKEFVAILGPSGCGKTTLLNIIGGLDYYTNGDLIIDGISTKKYKDKDWDNYRNHKIGFVFQTYNLIPHQRVRANVELALTISGIPKEERKPRVEAALAEVGLISQIRKRPNTLSGGQMQRVAIARALVNNPEIILADEPTGALDSEASLNVMEILKKTSEEHLVIMVTHNPDLAYKYATRIIEMKDGEIVSDSRPLNQEEPLDLVDQLEIIENLEANAVDVVDIDTEDLQSIQEEQAQKLTEGKGVPTPKQKKSKMKFKSAFMLSLANLYTKKMRTTATTFAGSIGIIGMTLVLALSVGSNAYIRQVEENALAEYPIVIQENAFELSKVMEILRDNSTQEEHHPNDQEVYEKIVMGNVLSYISQHMGESNNLKAIKQYLDKNLDESDGFIKYDYGTRINVFADYDTLKDENGNVIEQLHHTGHYRLYYPFAENVDAMVPEFAKTAIAQFGIDFSTWNMWEELPSNQTLLNQQYDVVQGRWPSDKGSDGSAEKPFEAVLTIGENNEIPDWYSLLIGFKNADPELVMKGLSSGQPETFKISDILNVDYRFMPQSDFFYLDENDGKYHSYYADSKYYTATEAAKGEFNEIIANSYRIKIVGVVRPKPGITAGVIKSAMAFSENLTNFVKNKNANSDVYKAQMKNITINPDGSIEGNAANIVIGNEEYSYGEAIDPIKYNTFEKFAQDYLKELGWVSETTPNRILIYASSLDGKENIKKMFQAYETESGENLSYSDSIDMIMGAIKQIINAITYVLVGFSAISLVVSSIMIAIITYTSVVERTREIGILRAIGARKHDIASIFNSETLIEGFLSGIVGVFIAWIITLPINVVVFNRFKIVNIAEMVWWHVFLMILLSVSLNLLSGLIPSQIAAKRDPVKSLRSE